ncbi:MAG: S9 family peptidase [Gemmatimonadota bacterium]|nr:S9 family peptidase [Gemmatimonadota bacterium]
MRTGPLFATALVAAATLSASEPAAGQGRGYRPSDYYDLVTVGDVQVSPRGTHVAFVVTTVVEEENRRHREIWMQRLVEGRPDGDPWRFTGPTEDATEPVWSPDGALLAFQSRRGEDPNPTWFLRVDGAGGEAFHIEGVEGTPVWSPDGSRIAFVKAEDGPSGERAGWIAPDAVTETLDPQRFDGRVVTSTRYKRDGTLTLRPHWSVSPKGQLHVVAAAGGTARRLTDVAFDVGAPLWSEDGRYLYFAGDASQDDETGTDPTGDLWIVAADGGGVRRLTTDPGAESAPALSPDGRWLAWLATPARGAQTDVWVVAVDGDGTFRGDPRNLTDTWDRDPGAPRWAADGLRLRFPAQLGGDVHLVEVPVSGGAVRTVTSGERQLSSISFSADDGVMAYAVTDAVTPTELFVARGDGTAERRATGFNDDWLARVTLRRPERLAFRVRDGTEVEGWIVPPVGYREGSRYPLILKIHGGPHSAYGNTFFPTFHVLSAAGFFVLYTNPRGSSGYGHDFQYATRGQWGVVDKEDYLTAVDQALARYPDIDPERLGVSGGSYGGFMTNWLTATTNRFAAAVTSRSIVNWESWYGSSDAQGLTEYEFFGPPWEQRELYRRLSPISYVENVRAPTLIIHSENDYRTPIGDGEQWFMALKKRGVPTELVRYPRSSHGLSRTGEPWLLVDRLERIRSWFEHFLGSETVRTSDAPTH